MIRSLFRSRKVLEFDIVCGLDSRGGISMRTLGQCGSENTLQSSVALKSGDRVHLGTAAFEFRAGRLERQRSYDAPQAPVSPQPAGAGARDSKTPLLALIGLVAIAAIVAIVVVNRDGGSDNPAPVAPATTTAPQPAATTAKVTPASAPPTTTAPAVQAKPPTSTTQIANPPRRPTTQP